MNRSIPILFAAAGLLLLSECRTVPLTGRKQMNLVSSSEIMALSSSQYTEVINASALSRNQTQLAMINNVGKRIQAAVEKYMGDNGMSDQLEGFAWEFNLIESEEKNAWCMPGGKVAFYTGILPVCQGETGVAVVMGHEIAHAIARHGNERMSQSLATQLGGTALSVAIANEPETTQQLAMVAFGVGSQLGVMLPYSRLHESEADKMGLFFMAMAGYDPKEAPKFWERMGSDAEVSPPEFISTHPSHETREANLNCWMPEALTYYEKAAVKGSSTRRSANPIR